MPVTLLSSKISVLTVSTVMIGPPDFSTTRFPGLKTVIRRRQPIRRAIVQTMRRHHTDTRSFILAYRSDSRASDRLALIAKASMPGEFHRDGPKRSQREEGPPGFNSFRMRTA